MKNLQPPSSTWETPFTCSKCTGRATVEGADLRHTPAGGHQRDPYPESFWFKCPFCGQKHNVPTNTLPEMLKISVRKREAEREPIGKGNY